MSKLGILLTLELTVRVLAYLLIDYAGRCVQYSATSALSILVFLHLYLLIIHR